MKAVITNRIYLEADSRLMEALSAQLTYKIPPKSKAGFPEVIRTFTRISPKLCSIPAGRIDLIPEGYTVKDERVAPPATFPKFRFPLRESQDAVVKEVDSSCMVNAPVSWGKTFTGIAIAEKLKVKTLIITHNTMLRGQWEKEIEKTLGIEGCSIIGSGRFELDGPIVVSNIQTLTKHVDKVADVFGLVIVDEAHHTPASTFSGILDKLKCRYKIGLSGTLNRKDGKHVVFTDFFGPKVFKPEKENCMTPSVVLVNSNIKFPTGQHWANRVTELETYNPTYQRLIAGLASRAADRGHKVLVVGSRVEGLKKYQEFSTRPSILITGEIKNLEERDDLLSRLSTGEADIVYGTMSIFSEGVSQNDLSCLILATPLNNESLLTQLVGRIIRLKEGKPNPVIIDVQLDGLTVKNQAKLRQSVYLREGYAVRVLKI